MNNEEILTGIIRLTELWKPLLLTVQYFKQHGDEVDVLSPGFGFKLRSDIYTVAFFSCLFVLNVCCVVAVSEYLMKPRRALHCCSFGHRVSGKTLSLVLPSVGINKEGLKSPATVQGSSMLTIKANPSLCRYKSWSLTARWRGLKVVLYTLRLNANPSIILYPLSRHASPGAAEPCEVFAHYSPRFTLKLWEDLWRE